jgi:sugar diacid utilization regulator
MQKARAGAAVKRARKSRSKPAAPRPRKPKRAPEAVAEKPFATLAGLVETLGAEVFRILSAPKGLDVKVTEPVIDDPIDHGHFEPGDIVLAVGTALEDRHAGELIQRAASCGGAAVVFKLRNGAESDTQTAESAGIALASVQPEMTWNQLHALLKTAIASSGELPQEGPGIPVGDLFALANAVAAMVGGPATIEDTQSRVLAFSSNNEPLDEPRRQTILGRRVPEPWIKRLQQHGVFKELWSTDDVIRVELPYKNLRRRIAIAIRAGGEILGSIWVAEGRKHLGPEAEEALREASRIAALHLIRHRASEDLERRMRGDVLRALLQGQGPVEHLASRLGIDARSPFTVMAFDLQSTGEAEDALERQRAVDLVALYSETFHRRAACASIERTIYSLLPTQGDQRGKLVSLGRRVIDYAVSPLGVTLKVGIGSTVPILREAPRSRSEADQVLRVLAQDARGRSVAAIEDVRAQTLLLEFQDLSTQHPHLRAGKLTALADYDAEHGTEYVQTLRAYLDAFGDIGKAAVSVNVHPNTFRYRVKRLSELSNIDLEDPDERLAAEIQLRLIN